jgi:hypothetical protein
MLMEPPYTCAKTSRHSASHDNGNMMQRALIAKHSRWSRVNHQDLLREEGESGQGN